MRGVGLARTAPLIIFMPTIKFKLLPNQEDIPETQRLYRCGKCGQSIAYSHVGIHAKKHDATTVSIKIS